MQGKCRAFDRHMQSPCTASQVHAAWALIIKLLDASKDDCWSQGESGLERNPKEQRQKRKKRTRKIYAFWLLRASAGSDLTCGRGCEPVHRSGLSR